MEKNFNNSNLSRLRLTVVIDLIKQSRLSIVTSVVIGLLIASYLIKGSQKLYTSEVILESSTEQKPGGALALSSTVFPVNMFAASKSRIFLAKISGNVFLEKIGKHIKSNVRTLTIFRHQPGKS